MVIFLIEKAHAFSADWSFKPKPPPPILYNKEAYVKTRKVLKNHVFEDSTHSKQVGCGGVWGRGGGDLKHCDPITY